MENNNFNATNNGTYNKQHPKTTRKNATFSQGAMNKTDVGEFQDGYFVMAEATKENKPQRTKNYHNNTNKTTERHPPLERHKSDGLPSRPPHQQHRGRSAQDLYSTSNSARQEGDSNVSPQRSSPTRSPNRNRRTSPNSQPQLDNSSAPLSPHKPRKAQYEKHVDRTESLSPVSGSPPKDKGPSPTSSRWAGPAFSNAPPPSSLPLPEFPPFAPQSSSPPPAPQPVSAPQPIPHFQYPPEPYFFMHPVYHPPIPHPSHYSNFTYGSPAPSLDQLSFGLRQMLHINEQVAPIPA